MKRILLNIFVGLCFLSILYSTHAFANVDITLQDDPSNKKISIAVDSNDEYIDGIDMSIIFSDNITIKEEDLPKSIDACTLVGKIYLGENKLYLECLNDSGTKMSGVIATIPYSATDNNYYFYVDTSTLDLGNKEKGTITNINYSNNNTDVDETDSAENTFNKIVDFIDSNFYYIIGGSILLVIAIVLVTKISKPKDESKTAESIEQIPDESNLRANTENKAQDKTQEESNYNN